MSNEPVPTLAVWKFASCDGCQLSLLDCEDELLALAGAVRIAHFTELSRASVDGPYDVSLVEGSVTTPEDEVRILEIRAASHRLITIGACATSGGVQALRNFAAEGEYTGIVYAHPEYVSSLATSTPISAHVPVDFELNGCPIDRHQLLEVITAGLVGRRPGDPGLYGVPAVQGPGGRVRAGCAWHRVPRPRDAGRMRRAVPVRRPRLLWLFRAGRGANTDALAGHLLEQGMDPADAVRLFSTYYTGNAVFGRQAVTLRSRASQRTVGPVP